MKSINKKDLVSGEVYYMTHKDGCEYIVTYEDEGEYGHVLWITDDQYQTDSSMDEEEYGATYYLATLEQKQWLQNCIDEDLDDCHYGIEEYKPKIAEYEIY